MSKSSPLIEERHKKLKELEEKGIAPFPNDLRPAHRTADLTARFEEMDREALEGVQERFSLAGRLMSVRLFGKAGFGHLQDSSGRLQAFFQQASLTAEEFDLFKKTDIGDIIWVEGTPMRTKTGELSLKVDKFRLATKSLRPLPEKWHGLTDIEQRYRQRYVDLIVNEPVRDVFKKRSAIIETMRSFLQERGFLEVETPMLQRLAGGAAARPFMTHHNTLDLDLKLRIAPELYLKRLVVGGFDRVFELNRNFRNEGISTQHNPEFTMLEFYQAYARDTDLMELTEQMLADLAVQLHDGAEFSYQGETLSFQAPFARYSFEESLLKVGDLPPEILTDEAKAHKLAAKHKIKPKAGGGLAALHAAFLEKFVEPKLIQPTYITDFPAAISPLARRSDKDARLTERFELYIAGAEIANGFSELNDPIDQEARFREQVEAARKGDEEAMPYDEDFVEALSYGMPPTAGEGIGIDRLVMILTDQASIRDVIAFPLLKPVHSGEKGES